MKNKTKSSSPDRVARMRRIKRNRAAAVMIFIFILIVGIVISFTLFFNITAIEINGSSLAYSSEDILANINIKVGQNIFGFSTKKVSNDLWTTLPYLDSVKIIRKLPSTVVIDISESKTSVTLPYAGGCLVLSESLKILENTVAIPDGCAKIYGLSPENYSVGMQLSTKTEGGTDYLQPIVSSLSLYGVLGKTTMINVSDKLNLSIVYEDRIFVMIGTANNLDYKIRMMNDLVFNELDATATGNLDLSLAGKGIFKPCELVLPDGYQNFAQIT